MRNSLKLALAASARSLEAQPEQKISISIVVSTHIAQSGPSQATHRHSV